MILSGNLCILQGHCSCRPKIQDHDAPDGLTEHSKCTRGFGMSALHLRPDKDLGCIFRRGDGRQFSPFLGTDFKHFKLCCSKSGEGFGSIYSLNEELLQSKQSRPQPCRPLAFNSIISMMLYIHIYPTYINYIQKSKVRWTSIALPGVLHGASPVSVTRSRG